MSDIATYLIVLALGLAVGALRSAMPFATTYLVGAAVAFLSASSNDHRRPKVCRRQIAIQPFSVMRRRPGPGLTINPRSQTTAEGG